MDNENLSSTTVPDHSPIEKKETSVCEFAAAIFNKSAEAINTEIEGVRKGRDIEFVHRMRVASRRLRTALDVFDDCVPSKKKGEWRIQIKQLTQSLGETRDTDLQILLLENLYATLPVQAYRTGIRRLLLRLRQKRSKLQKEVLKVLDSLEKKRVLNQISNKFSRFVVEKARNNTFSTELFRLSFSSISKRLSHLLTYEIYLQSPEYVNELHQMRIAAKQLRYALEIFSPLYGDQLEIPIKSTRQAQQVLGEIHDCDIWTGFLPEFIEKERVRIHRYLGHIKSVQLILPGIKYFQTNREEERKKLFSDFQKSWGLWHKAELWLHLKQNLLQALSSSDK